MEQLLKEQIRDTVNKWIKPENTERTASKLALKAGISASYISHIKKGVFVIGNTPISDAVFLKLAVALGIREEEEQEMHWPTYNLELITKVCKSSQRKKKIVLLDSDDSGVGKTYSLEYFSTYNDKVLYIKCTKSMGVKDLLNEILHKLQIREKLVGDKAKIDAIKEKIITSPGFILIIDEAELVKPGVYIVIKEIIDFTYGRICVIVSGMGLKDKLERLAQKKREGFPQLKRRLFSNIVKVPSLSKKEIIEICERHSIKAVSAHSWFTNNVRDFQTLKEYIKDALEVSKKEQCKIDADFLSELFNTY